MLKYQTKLDLEIQQITISYSIWCWAMLGHILTKLLLLGFKILFS